MVVIRVHIFRQAISRGRRSLTVLALHSHPVVYHEDFNINPIPEGHRFPMPKDALLYQRLVTLGLAANTFTPDYPDKEMLCLVRGRHSVFGCWHWEGDRSHHNLRK
jgi:hypothetical protein